MNYTDLLKHPKWIEKRGKILSRDLYMCQNNNCMSSVNLHVHHKYYLDGKMPWEYPDSALITYCDKCHKEEHYMMEVGPDDPYVRCGKIIRSAVEGIIGMTRKSLEEQNNG